MVFWPRLVNATPRYRTRERFTGCLLQPDGLISRRVEIAPMRWAARADRAAATAVKSLAEAGGAGGGGCDDSVGSNSTSAPLHEPGPRGRPRRWAGHPLNVGSRPLPQTTRGTRADRLARPGYSLLQGPELGQGRSVRRARATPPFTNRTSVVSPSWFVFPRPTVTSTPSPSAASSTSAQRRALTSLRRIPAMKRSPATASSRPRSRATWSDSVPRPRRRGRWQVARTAARSAAPNGRACPRPRSPAVRR